MVVVAAGHLIRPLPSPHERLLRRLGGDEALAVADKVLAVRLDKGALCTSK
jgi:hypothetical protein